MVSFAPQYAARTLRWMPHGEDSLPTYTTAFGARNGRPAFFIASHQVRLRHGSRRS